MDEDRSPLTLRLGSVLIFSPVSKVFREKPVFTSCRLTVSSRAIRVGDLCQADNPKRELFAVLETVTGVFLEPIGMVSLEVLKLMLEPLLAVMSAKGMGGLGTLRSVSADCIVIKDGS